ncbi:hypothetical protein OWR29_10745 [Actinoplanes sp. Pm04-4]|uniref:Uncharacterized protein n=1 Tax=Paractinoplanes pyxinae TaxID=2997416 RepID=A0ABT4AXV2_9ACTN|nr:hypothetical protein [Actinoplanes pyxinae]MCY1138475.1 hypothetical protein [Actinoplanes pyxinae]
MPGQRFTVQLPEAPVLSELALPGKARRKSEPEAKHHGAGDERQAARQRSEQARAGRAAGAGGGRSYAFRRS